MPAIYWNEERFDNARARGFFMPEEVQAASDWTTCACGQQDPRIPRGRNADYLDVMDKPVWLPEAPKDRRLFLLGQEFYNVVGRGDVEGAEEILDAIERRSAIVLRHATKEAR